MNALEFARAIAGTGMSMHERTAKACRRVLVDGLTAYAAAKEAELSQANMSRALKMLRNAEPANHCPKCGEALKV